MSGIAGIVSWDTQVTAASTMDWMMRRIRHRGPQRLFWEARPPVIFGHALLALEQEEVSHVQPLWLPDASCGVVADIHLHNRGEVHRQLGEREWFRGRPSDAALLLAAYEQWGVEFLSRIDGDFAFAIWDAKRRRIFAARDPFGTKPFFYRTSSRSFIFGSEPKQLLGLPDVPRVPDEKTIGEYLLSRMREPDRTFFSGIARLKPGHCLYATPTATTQERYWNPDPEREVRYPSHRDYIERFRELLKAAVAKRLRTDFPIGADLSGGFDSSSVVVLAGELYQQNRATPLPPLETLSATFSDLSCDESPYIRAVAAQVPFRSHLFSPRATVLTEGLLDDFWKTDSPRADIQRGMMRQRASLLSSFGARTLLTGVGGDEIVHEEHYLRDLARQKRFLALLHDTWVGSRTSWNSCTWLFFDALRALAPPFIKQLYQHLRRGKTQLPEWLQPTFAQEVLRQSSSPPQPGLRFKSLTQEAVFQALNLPGQWWGVEYMECHGSYAGYEIRHPFLDRPLVEFILAVPVAERRTRGQWKYLLRAALASSLPPVVLQRKRKAHFGAYVAEVWAKGEAQLKELLFSTDRWAAEEYISKEKVAQVLMHSVTVDEVTAPQIRSLWRAAMTELWLRQVSRYIEAS